MARFWRALAKLSIYGLIVVITLVILGYWLITKSLPKTSGTLTYPIFEHPVDVYRDSLGVSHIFAKNDADLFRAAGFVTAQDRLWQMDFYRRAASGRLSEIFGDVTLEQDKLLRLWGFRRVAEAISDSLSPQSRLALEAYAEGVNTFIESHKSRLPIEFALLDYTPEKWQIEDSIALTRLMAWQLSFSWYVDIVLAEVVNRVGMARAREIFPEFPKDGPFILSGKEKELWETSKAFLKSGENLLGFLGLHGVTVGSNAWVISGAKTVSGKPLLANDPHLELMAPSIWYQIHLSSKNMNVAGVALPGVPGIVIGHNEEIAWGLTNGMIDDVDFYLERVNTDSVQQYWTGKKWLGFSTHQEEIKVKGTAPTRLTIRSSQNGPVISDLHPLLKGQGPVISMRWVGHAVSDELDAYLKLLKSSNWNDFTEAIRGYKVPAQNFVFASKSGDIGYYLGGSVPIRKNTTGVHLHKGWRQTGKWVGELAFAKLPHVLNPEQGFIVTANNKIVSSRYPFYLSNLWEPPGRAAKISELLAQKDTFSVTDFQTMQLDVGSVFARDLLPDLLDIVEAKLDSSAPRLNVLYNLIRDWDGTESLTTLAPSIFHAFFVKLLENTLQDEMGEELFRFYIKARNVPFRVMTKLLRNRKSNWFDNVDTAKVESMEDIVIMSFLDAGTLLEKVAGAEISHWRWGEIHALTMKHVLGVRRPLSFLLNIGPLPRGGSTMTINNSEYRIDQPFKSVVGPSMRQVVDLSDMNESFSIITSGASGQRMSRHYKDQTPLWQNGKYHRLVLDRTTIENTATAHLVLTP